MTVLPTSNIVTPLRGRAPRLYRCADDPDFRFAPPADAVRRRILANIVRDCREFERVRPPARLPERLDSPHPYHQLYIAFYESMRASALIEQYSFAALVTRDPRWLRCARRWLRAAVAWEHSDRVEETFYVANRYMQAFAVALDWLDDVLEEREKAAIVECLVKLMRRWWPEVRDQRHEPAPGHHVVVDNGHFGVAALALLGRVDEAGEWVAAVVDRFRAAVMPHGCAADGAPIDGPGFWAAENMWMLHFVDALRNVTGVDLCRGHRERLRRPAAYMRHLLALHPHARPAASPIVPFAHVAPVLLRLAQEAGDAPLRAAALGDADLGRLYHYTSGVKNSSAECMLTYGPYAYMYYDPAFKGRVPRTPARCRRLDKSRGATMAILRSDWSARALTLAVWEFAGAVTHGAGRLDLLWAGHTCLRVIYCRETRPVPCGSMPFVGDQNEMIFVLGRLRQGARADCLKVDSPRVEQEYWLLRGRSPGLLLALRRKPRGIRHVEEGGLGMARCDGTDYLQYASAPHFNPDRGELRLRVRLRAPRHGGAPEVLFNTGVGVPDSALTGLGVDVFSLGVFDGGKLRFAVQSNRMRVASVDAPTGAAIERGRWHDVVARWGGFNGSGGAPFIEVALDGRTARLDDQAVFGEMGSDSQGLASRATPRPFNIESRTVLAFGAAVQIPGTGADGDIAEINLACPGRTPLRLDFKDGLGPETGGAEMGWKLHPTALKRIASGGAVLGAGSERVRVIGLNAYGAQFSAVKVPFAAAGFAATSLKYLAPGAQDAATRVLARAIDRDIMLLLFAPAAASVSSRSDGNRLDLRLAGRSFRFAIDRTGPAILRAVVTPQ